MLHADDVIAGVDVVDLARHRARQVGDEIDRRGTDVVKALCLGATAVCIGRPFLYGLAAGGPDGVSDVLSILRTEIARTLRLMGACRVSELDRSWLIRNDERPAPSRAEENVQ